MTCTSYQIDGISTWRCGSLASNGRPVFVRDPAITQLLLSPARAVRSSHSSPGGMAGVSSRACPDPIGCGALAGAAVAACGAGAAASRIAGAPGGIGPMSRLVSAGPIARVSRPRTSSPRRFSARRQASSRATASESTGVHASGVTPSSRNSGGRFQRPIAAVAALTPAA